MGEEIWAFVEPDSPLPDPIGTIRWTTGRVVDTGQPIDVEFVKVGHIDADCDHTCTSEHWQFTGRVIPRFQG